MCGRRKDCCDKSKERAAKRISRLKGLAKALHCPTRWDIIDIIGTGSAKTKEIKKGLIDKGYDISQSGLYYHLSELRDSGIIEVDRFLEEGQGAPEKVWKLTKKKIEIDLVVEEEN